VAQAGPAAPVLGQDDDVDALDKQWVAKAKAVVANTKDDPYLQSHELSRVKADFLQARYGKESKVAEIKPV
jgi:hypothetical protein